jgi:hypothetical protein
MKRLTTTLLAIAFVAPAMTDDVTVETFVRAESDHMIRANMDMLGVGFGAWIHLRKPTTPNSQPVIRMNQDARSSATVVDLSKPATITLREVGGRYKSMPNEDGSYTLHFGGCDDGRISCIPISPGWYYAIRMYEPREEILDGSWSFPAPQSVDRDAMVARGPRRERA